MAIINPSGFHKPNVPIKNFKTLTASWSYLNHSIQIVFKKIEWQKQQE